MPVLGAFTLIVLGGVIQDWTGNRFGSSSLLLAFFATLRRVIIVLALLLGIAIIYRYGPNRKQRLEVFSMGTVFATAGLILASIVFSLYTSNFGDYNAVYGSVGAVIVLMLWLYLAGLMLLLGAEINLVLARRRDRSLAPKDAPAHGRR